MRVRRWAMVGLGLVWLLSAAVPAGAAAGQRLRVDSLIADAHSAMLSDPKRALVRSRSAQAVAQTLPITAARDLSLATSLWLQGEAQYRLNNLSAAAPLIHRALASVRRTAPKSKLEGDILLSSGSTHGETGDVAAALSDFQAAHAIFVAIDDARGRATALICLGLLYNDGKDYVSALKYFGQALDVYHSDATLELAIRNNRAYTLRQLGRYADADRQYRLALRIAEQMRSAGLRVTILRNIARNALAMNDVARAERALARSAVLARQSDDADTLAMSSIAAQAALQRGRLHAAAVLVERSLAGVDPTTTTLAFRETHQTAYDVFQRLGDADKALVQLTALKRLDDQATRLATSSGAALMAARFDYANQELRIAQLRSQELRRSVASERQRADSQWAIFLIAAGATAALVAALGFALFVVRRSRNTVRAANADLADTNAALSKALSAKTEFLATTSHEIRTPLNGILGMTQVMLADRALCDTMRDRLSVVQGAGVAMKALVDDILDIAKIETGNLTLESAAFDLRAIIAETTPLWDHQAQAKGVDFRCDLDGCPGLVMGDAARVKQIVFNLLSNALKFTAVGSIGIAVRGDSAGAVTIAVRDTGIGIAADQCATIFDSFRQADASTTRQFGGTGLGLAICRQLARAMGGDVTVTSMPGRGSVFTVALTLPAAVPVATTTSTVKAHGLLIVERNPIARSLFKELFAPHAPYILFAASAEEAAAVMAAGGIDRVLIDDATIRAAGDHRAALRMIADVADGRAETILLWPIAADAERRDLFATGMGHIIAKPVSGPSLVASLFPIRNDLLVSSAA